MNQPPSFLNYFFASLLAVLFGIGLAAGGVFTVSHLWTARPAMLALPPNVILIGLPVAPDYPFATSTVTLGFVGDIMLDRGVEAEVENNAEGDFKSVFADLGPLRSVDILFGNLEGPVSEAGHDLGGQYSFRMSPYVLPALKAAGFKVLSVANNHAGDWGRVAFADSLKRLAEADLLAVGGGRDKAEASQPKVIEQGGIKIGYLGFTDVGPNWLQVSATSSGVLLVSDPNLADMVRQAKAEVDILVVSFHFGNEYEYWPSARQKELVYLAIDSGADIVIGHHPHVVQPVERYRGGLIAYSLGNFVFDQSFSPETMNGEALIVKLVNGKIADHKTYRTRIDNLFRVSVSND